MVKSLLVESALGWLKFSGAILHHVHQKKPL
jgi:hypothetical protein